LRFSYLRGLDGRLPEESASTDKTASTDAGKNTPGSPPIDLSPLEKADGNSQLDYLRRLADHIAREDEAYRRNGESGIGAIGILGVDAYDKLLVLQALKSRMPYKLYFSTDLDARMLQRGQAQTTRNLILAAPYGLTLTRALQQDVPPFRDSLQSAVFVSVLAALAPQSFDAKRAKFDYSKSELLSPGIYEVGISGFIPLATRLSASGRSIARRRPNRNPIAASAPTTSWPCAACKILATTLPRTVPVDPRAFQTNPVLFLGRAADVLLADDRQFHPLVADRRSAGRSRRAAGLGARRADQPVHGRGGVRLHRHALLACGVSLVHLRVDPAGHPVIEPDPAFHPKTGAGRGSDGQSCPDDAWVWYIVVPLVMFILALMLAYQMRSTLTDNGLGEPMFLFEGISAWPTVALRLLAVLISISALTWGWRKLRINRAEIETTFHLRLHMRKYEMTLWGQVRRLLRRAKAGACGAGAMNWVTGCC
jgi:hypothetical protein